MRRFTILYIFLTSVAFSQNLEIEELKQELIGEWALGFSLNITPNESVIDTIRTDSLKSTMGLVIRKNRVDEFWHLWDSSNDTTVYMGQGNWTIEHDSIADKIWVDFNCEGVFLCGHFQLLRISPKKLVLKSCSMYEYEGCQLDYLFRKSDPLIPE